MYVVAFRPSIETLTSAPPAMPTESEMIVRKKSMKTVATSRGGDQFTRRIGAQRAHRVDLLRHLHGAEFGGHTGGVAAAETISAVSTGPSSLTIDRATSEPGL